MESKREMQKKVFPWSLLILNHSCLEHQNLMLSGLYTPKSRLPGLQPQCENYTVGSLGYETFEYGFRQSTSIPGSLACTWPSLGLLSLHHDLRKFYPINSFSYHLFSPCISYFSVSLENLD